MKIKSQKALKYFISIPCAGTVLGKKFLYHQNTSIFLLYVEFIILHIPPTFQSQTIVCVGNFIKKQEQYRIYEGWNFNSGNYLFTTDTK